MDDVRLAGMLTRRAAVMLAAAAPQSFGHEGEKTMGRPVVHFEIGCRDQAKTSEFFSKLFGWQIQAAGPAYNIDTGSGQGIAGHITSLGHEPLNYTMFYVDVEDVQAALDKATELGGKMIVGPIKIPTGTFAWFSDPDGNTIGLLQRAK
ncbi:VOC family protein [uncultured Paludibaculum sp.]|uniref:VOC family protein n=1 Tax=uncultured Paludibaculum sp. TaxID=1765020 RepID=UPI002AABD525|nr:VOC family protein [uncultured Paludibaculum sp.]